MSILIPQAKDTFQQRLKHYLVPAVQMNPHVSHFSTGKGVPSTPLVTPSLSIMGESTECRYISIKSFEEIIGANCSEIP